MLKNNGGLKKFVFVKRDDWLRSSDDWMKNVDERRNEDKRNSVVLMKRVVGKKWNGGVVRMCLR